jgi:diguanylate cyclase (GGDEF)-like protein
MVGFAGASVVTHAAAAAINRRETDSIARIGGEGFALLLPHTDLQQAIQLCEHLRQRIANHDWQTIAPNLKVTVSIASRLLPGVITVIG